MPLEVDMTDLPLNLRRKIHDVVTDEAAVQIMHARIRQAKLQKFYQDNQPRSIDGVGGLRTAVDPFWVGYFNMQHRRQVWSDPDFTKWLEKQDDLFRPLRAKGTRVQVGYSPTGTKFSKRYGDR